MNHKEALENLLEMRDTLDSIPDEWVGALNFAISLIKKDLIFYEIFKSE